MEGNPITVGQAPSGVAYDPDNKGVYVTNALSGTVSVINTTTNTVVATISLPQIGTSPVPPSPWSIAYDSSTHEMYVTADNSRFSPENLNSGTVFVINTSNNAVVAIINVGSVADVPHDVAYDSDIGEIYVANGQYSSTVSVINTTTHQVEGNPITVGSGPMGIAYNLYNKGVYVANEGSGTISVINATTHQVEGNPITGESRPNSCI